MSAQSDAKLDKSTPESKWKEILSADEVLHRLLLPYVVASTLACPDVVSQQLGFDLPATLYVRRSVI